MNSKIVVDRFNSNLEDSSELGCIIHACRQLYAYNFHNSCVEFNRRQANWIAHELAHVALSQESSHVYDDVPSCIRQLIASEKQ